MTTHLNSSKRKQDTIKRLPSLGFNENYFIEIMTSGEMIWQSLLYDQHIITKNLGKNCFHIFDQSKEDSLKFTVGSSAGTISSSTGNNYFDYRIEGYDSARVRMGTAYAKTVTVSFWVKASVTGAYGFTLGQDLATCYATSYTVNVANTWEKKTITVPGTSSGTWNTGNTVGIRLIWNWGAGSNYTASSVGWATADDRGGYDAGSAVQLVANANATWFITGIQLELGSNATPFEHRSYAEELSRCLRYYNIVGGGIRCSATGNSTTSATFSYSVSVRMRATPALVHINSAAHRIYRGATQSFDSSSTNFTISDMKGDIVNIAAPGYDALTDNRGYTMGMTGSYAVGLSSEL